MTPSPDSSNNAHAAVAPSGDDALVARIAAGDEGAFKMLFEAHYDALCIFCENFVRSPQVAEELVEDVFCWIWEHRAEWRVQPGFVKPYLYRAVRNRALRQVARFDVANREQERAVQEGRMIGMSQAGRSPDEQYEVNAFAHAVERAVAALPERCRQVFSLYRQHGLTHAEVAAAMDISVKTVENQLARAVKSLRMSLAAWNPRGESKD